MFSYIMAMGKRYTYSRKSTADKALALAKKANRNAKGEVKHATVDTTASIISSTPAVQGNLVNIPQNDTGNGRDGNLLRLKSMYFRYYITQHPSASTTSVRCVIVRDKQQVADTSPTWTSVYESASVTSHINNETIGRYEILMDRVHSLGDRKVVNSKFYKKQSHAVRYNGSAFTDIQQGGLYFLAISDEATNTPTVVWSNRVSYTDN